MTRPMAGELVDFVPFGKLCAWRGNDPRSMERMELDRTQDAGSAEVLVPFQEPGAAFTHLGVEWEEPRDIRQVVVSFSGNAMPALESVQIQYWQRNWPFPYRSGGRGASRGWIGRDDPFHGQWITVNADVSVQGKSITYDFHHLDFAELPNEHQLNNAEDYNAPFRKTLKIRVIFKDGALYPVRKLSAYSGCVWNENEFDVLTLTGGKLQLTATAWNGIVDDVKAIPSGARIRLFHTGEKSESSQRTVISLNVDGHAFGVMIPDVMRRPVFLKDLNLLVKRSEDERQALEIVHALLCEGEKCIYDRVFDEPEQTVERALAETPRLQKVMQHPPYGRYVVLGGEGSRQEFALRHNGNLFASKGRMKAKGRDLKDVLWPACDIQYHFATGNYPDFREREYGAEQERLPGESPVFRTTWVDRDIEFVETAFAAYLREDMGQPLSKHGEEDIVALLRFRIRNTCHDSATVFFWIQPSPDEILNYNSGIVLARARLVRFEAKTDPEFLWHAVPDRNPDHHGWVSRAYDEELIRFGVEVHGRGNFRTASLTRDERSPQGYSNALLFTADLAGGESTEVIVKIPFITLRGEEGSQRLREVDFETKFVDVTHFWRRFIDSGMELDLPDKMVEHFYRAVAANVAINADKDPKTGAYIVPAGTYSYGACGNEACIQIRQMDYRGYHKLAEKYLDGLLLVQGAGMPDGNFKDKTGALQGINFYDGEPLQAGFAYNLDHGFIFACLCEHYWLTRDEDWLRRIAPNLVAAADFVIRERQATMFEENGERSPAWGLLPAGHLEDNPEWRHWFAVNGHAHLGMKRAALVLAEINHPEADRMAREAEAYRQDILSAMRRAMAISPAVRLLDQTSVPHIPVRTHLHGPEWGWFREIAYGPLHLVDGDVIDPDSEEATWIHEYMEDRGFPDRDIGRPIDLEKRWFSQGGVTIQENLLNNSVAYLRRDEVQHSLRALWNDFAASLYPDVLVFTEHPVVELGRGVGPYYKTPDECGFLNTLRMHLVMEEDDVLWLARGASRSWFLPGQHFAVRNAASYFGPLSYEIETHQNTILCRLAPPHRNPPSLLLLRLRHGEERVMKAVKINGRDYRDFDPETEIIRISELTDKMEIEATY